MRKKKLRLSFLVSSILLTSCAVTIPNTRFCSVAGVMEAGMDCFHTLSDDENHIEPVAIKAFLESEGAITDEKGNVLVQGHGAAICQSSEDWGAEHTALELACQKLGASCTMDIRKMIDSVTKKVDRLQNPVLQ